MSDHRLHTKTDQSEAIFEANLNNNVADIVDGNDDLYSDGDGGDDDEDGDDDDDDDEDGDDGDDDD